MAGKMYRIGWTRRRIFQEPTGAYNRKPFRIKGLITQGTAVTVLEMERVMGIEPTLEAWEAAVLPLNYTREGRTAGKRSRQGKGL